MTTIRIIQALGAAGCSVEAKKETACSDEREHGQNSEASNGLAGDSPRSSRMPPPMRHGSRCVARERSLCCVGDTNGRFAERPDDDEREKTRPCLPAIEWVPRQRRYRTAERFSVARLFDSNASEHLVLTEGAMRGFPHTHPTMARRARSRRNSPFSLRIFTRSSSRFFAMFPCYWPSFRQPARVV